MEKKESENEMKSMRDPFPSSDSRPKSSFEYNSCYGSRPHRSTEWRIIIVIIIVLSKQKFPTKTDNKLAYVIRENSW